MTGDGFAAPQGCVHIDETQQSVLQFLVAHQSAQHDLLEFLPGGKNAAVLVGLDELEDAPPDFARALFDAFFVHGRGAFRHRGGVRSGRAVGRRSTS